MRLCRKANQTRPRKALSRLHTCHPHESLGFLISLPPETSQLKGFRNHRSGVYIQRRRQKESKKEMVASMGNGLAGLTSRNPPQGEEGGGGTACSRVVWWHVEGLTPVVAVVAVRPQRLLLMPEWWLHSRETYAYQVGWLSGLLKTHLHFRQCLQPDTQLRLLNTYALISRTFSLSNPRSYLHIQDSSSTR